MSSEPTILLPCDQFDNFNDSVTSSILEVELEEPDQPAPYEIEDNALRRKDSHRGSEVQFTRNWKVDPFNTLLL